MGIWGTLGDIGAAQAAGERIRRQDALEKAYMQVQQQYAQNRARETDLAAQREQRLASAEKIELDPQARAARDRTYLRSLLGRDPSSDEMERFAKIAPPFKASQPRIIQDPNSPTGYSYQSVDESTGIPLFTQRGAPTPQSMMQRVTEGWKQATVQGKDGQQMQVLVPTTTTSYNVPLGQQSGGQPGGLPPPQVTGVDAGDLRPDEVVTFLQNYIGYQDQIIKDMQSGKGAPKEFKPPPMGAPPQAGQAPMAASAQPQQAIGAGQPGRAPRGTIEIGPKPTRQPTVSEIAKVISPISDADRRLAVMEDAMKHPNPQNDVALTFNHIGMTLSAQKGARVTNAEIDRAIMSRSLPEDLLARWTRVTSGQFLTPDERKNMVELGIKNRELIWQAQWEQAKALGMADRLPKTLPGLDPVGGIPYVGQTKMMKNGQKVRITKIHPDGQIDVVSE